jgi:hypothetical protein
MLSQSILSTDRTLTTIFIDLTTQQSSVLLDHWLCFQGSVQVHSPHQLHGSHVQDFWQEHCCVSITGTDIQARHGVMELLKYGTSLAEVCSMLATYLQFIRSRWLLACRGYDCLSWHTSYMQLHHSLPFNSYYVAF